MPGHAYAWGLGYPELVTDTCPADLRADLGAYGLPVVTPHIDALAADGLTFAHAFCQMSVCSPSRQSFMTGLRPDTHRVWNFIDANPTRSRSVAGWFRDHGYAALGLGKTFHEDAGAWNADAYWNTTLLPYYPYEANACPKPSGGEGGGRGVQGAGGRLAGQRSPRLWPRGSPPPR